MSTGARVVTILVGDRRAEVPPGTSILAHLGQTVGTAIVEGNYCWTGECGHCEVTYHVGTGPERTAMACCLAATDGLRVVALSRHLESDLRR
jgi:hypothetical protein